MDVNLTVVKIPSAKWIMDAWKDIEKTTDGSQWLWEGWHIRCHQCMVELHRYIHFNITAIS